MKSMKQGLDFRTINFGKTDAQIECSRYPNLLIGGYFDYSNIVDKAINQDTFLFLGYKGSGKTALSEHISLTKESFDCHIEKMQMRDFPYRSFAMAMLPGESPEVQTSLSWRWLLFSRVFENLLGDVSAKTSREEDSYQLSQLLTKSGLMHPRTVAEFATKSISSSFKVKLGEFFEYEKSPGTVKECSFVDVIDLLRDVIASYSTNRRLIITIDGLDDILISDEIQYISIGTLFTEVNELNSFFVSNSLPIKIIVFCRTDIVGRIPNTNKNKIIQDLSFSFNWYEQGLASIQDCALIQIGDLRAKLVYPQINSLLSTFFPRRFKYKPIGQALLEFTRHTPRDYIQILNKIQSVCIGPMVTYADIAKGIVDYSVNYFLGEIKDELVGYVQSSKIDSVFTLLSSLHKMQFSFDEVTRIASSLRSINTDELQQIFSVLFECSAIGNVYTYADNTYRYSFKYRNPIAAFNPNEIITIHKGLWKALNLNF